MRDLCCRVRYWICDYTVVVDFGVFEAYMSLCISSTPRASKGSHVTPVYEVTPPSVQVHHYHEVHMYLQRVRNMIGT